MLKWKIKLKNNIIFKLKNGFKLNINGNEIEKLEFTEYTINLITKNQILIIW